MAPPGLLSLLLLVSGCGVSEPSGSSVRDADRVANEVLREFSVEYGRRPDAFEPPDLAAVCSGVDSIVCVQDSPELLAALAARRAEIVLLDGTYDVGKIDITYGVTLRAATLWGAEIGGTSFLDLSGEGARVDGIRFEIGGSRTGELSTPQRTGALRILATRAVILSNNLFDRMGENSTVSDGTGIGVRVVQSTDVTIRDNVFRRSHAIAIKTDDYSTVRVVNNDFLDSVDFGGAGEVIQIGNAASIGQGLVPVPDATRSEFAFNYVSNWNLERELVSLKSSENRIHHNLFVDSGDAIVVRKGNDNEIWANLLRGNDEDFPLRISGERNRIHGNVFCGRGFAVSLHTEQGRVDPPANNVDTYWAAIDNTVSHNLYYGFDRIAHINPGYIKDDFFKSNPRDNVFVDNVMFNPTPVSRLKFVVGLILGRNIFVEEDRACPVG